MSTKAESAELILKLYELRREAVMREARQWFAGFNPQSAQEVADTLAGKNSVYFRMVTSYWDMAATFVNQGAIDELMFNEANAEHVFVFAKIEPLLEELRAQFGPQVVPNLEKLVMRMPGAKERMTHMREMSRKMAERRAVAEAADQR